MDEVDVFKHLIFILFPLLVNTERCITPNGKVAECISIYSCLKLTNGIIKEDKGAKQFVLKSYCGFERDPLICCGDEIKSSKLLSYLHHSKFYIHFDNYRRRDCNNCNSNVNLNVYSTHRRNSKTDKHEEHNTKDCTPSAFLKLIKPSRKSLENKATRRSRSTKGILRKTNYVYGRYCGKRRGSVVDEFPWLAAIIRYSHHNKMDDGFKCAGTFISDRHVLTSAACIVDKDLKPLKKVQLRSHHESPTPICIGKGCSRGLELEIDKIIPHPEYDTKQNNIGLIRLNKRFPYTERIFPICLWDKSFQLEKSAKSFVIPGLNSSILKSYNCGKIENEHRYGCSDLHDLTPSEGFPLMYFFKGQWYIEGILVTKNKTNVIATTVNGYLDWIVDNLT